MNAVPDGVLALGALALFGVVPFALLILALSLFVG